MGMRPADAYCPNQFDDFMLKRNRKIHRTLLRQGGRGSDLDMSRPQKFNHVGPNNSKKAFMLQESWKQIDYENNNLLGKMSKIAKGTASVSVGGPPPREKKSHRPAGAGGNQFVRKNRQARIESENKQMLRRITNADPQYSTNTLATQERERLKYLSNLSRFKKYQPKFVGNLQEALRAGAATDRAHHSLDYDGIDPTRMALAKVSEEEMTILVNNRRPPGSVRKVFTALMILVSPFETGEQDVQWTAVQEWVEQLGGVGEWLHNLWNFNIGLVPVANATRCKKYIVDKDLDGPALQQYSPCLAHFLNWVNEVCASAHLSSARNSRGSRRSAGAGSRTHRDLPPGSRASTAGGPKMASPDEFSKPSQPLDSDEDSSDGSPPGPAKAMTPVPPAEGRGSRGSRHNKESARPGSQGSAKVDEVPPPGALEDTPAAEQAMQADAEKAGQAAQAEKAAEAEKAVAAEKAAQEEEAAVKIQAVARGKRGRKKAEQKKQTLESEAGGEEEEEGYDDEFEEEDEYEDEFEDGDDDEA